MTNIYVSLVVAMALACPSLFAKSAFELAKANIPRFRIISNGVYAGGNPTSRAVGDQGKAAIVELGIGGVLSLQGGDIDGTWKGTIAEWSQKGENPEAIAEEKAYFEARGVHWSNYPLNSHATKTPEEDIAIMEALKQMAAATAQNPVFLHCEHGADRTGLLVALFHVFYEGWSPDLAYEDWLANGHGWLARQFTYFLDEYFFEKTGWRPTVDPFSPVEAAQVEIPTCAQIIAKK